MLTIIIHGMSVMYAASICMIDNNTSILTLENMKIVFKSCINFNYSFI